MVSNLFDSGESFQSQLKAVIARGSPLKSDSGKPFRLTLKLIARAPSPGANFVSAFPALGLALCHTAEPRVHSFVMVVATSNRARNTTNPERPCVTLGCRCQHILTSED